MTTEAKTVKLSELSIDPINVRKTARGGEPKFAASIRKRGVLEPLVVRPNPKGGYLIVNGGERYTALLHMKKKSEKANGVAVNDDFAVRVEVTDRPDAEARATSLATNLVRVEMHPVDEFEAFAAMIQEGATVELIATEYARTVPEVRQALSLAAIHPEIRKAWREGKIEGAAAEAYAQTKDLKHQLRVFQKLKKRAGNAWDVNQEIAGNTRGEIVPMLRFVTPAAYEAAGHHINPSLFQDEDRNETKVDNIPALKAMAERKLDEEILKLKQDGWAWVVLRDDAPRDLYSWRKLPDKPTKEQKALAGCTIQIAHNGDLEIVRGYIKPGVSIKIEKTPAQKAAAKKAGGKPKPSTISAALANRLSVSLTKATASVVEGCDHDSVLRMALAGLFCSSAYSESPICLENKGAGITEQEFDRDFPQELARLAKLKGRVLVELFAKTVAASVDMAHHSPDSMLVDDEGEVDHEASAALARFVPQKELQRALCTEFNADDYFESAPGAMALAAIADMNGIPMKNTKKSAQAQMAADMAKKQGWLPPQLRTDGYAGPKAKPARRKK